MTNIDQEAAKRRADGRPFAMATVVRTVAPTAAKPGDKAILDADGSIAVGFLGGGCVRGAVAKAGRLAIETGQTQLVSLKPQELLDEAGFTAGEERDGVRYARNGCPSKGALDIFVEPVLPFPRLVVCGNSAVAHAFYDLAGRFDFQRITAYADDTELATETHFDGFDRPELWKDAPFVLVATQGQGDDTALRHALMHPTRFVAFVGSKRKFDALAAKLIDAGVPKAKLAQVNAPAGIDINAITPDEIALSVLAQVVAARRADKRGDGSH